MGGPSRQLLAEPPCFERRQPTLIHKRCELVGQDRSPAQPEGDPARDRWRSRPRARRGRRRAPGARPGRAGPVGSGGCSRRRRALACGCWRTRRSASAHCHGPGSWRSGPHRSPGSARARPGGTASRGPTGRDGVSHVDAHPRWRVGSGRGMRTARSLISLGYPPRPVRSEVRVTRGRGVRAAGRWERVGARVGCAAISAYPPAEVFSWPRGGTAKVQRRSTAVSSCRRRWSGFRR